MKINQSSLNKFVEKYFNYESIAKSLFPVAMTIIDARGNFIYANDHYINIYNLKSDHIQNHNLLELAINAKHAKELKQHLSWLIQEQPYPTPYIGLNKTLNGDVLHVRVDWDYVYYNDKVLGFLSVITNMSEQVPNIESYRANEAIVNAMMETILCGVLILSLEGYIIELNPLCNHILHLSKEKIIGKSLEDILIPFNSRKNTMHTMLSNLNGGGVSEYKLIEKVNHVNRYVLLEFATSINYKSIASLIVFVKDITHDKTKAHALAMKKRELETHYRQTLVTEIVSGMAHEMNQPLAAITNYTQGCMRRLKEANVDSEVLKSLEMVVRQAKRASNIIHHMRQWDQDYREDFKPVNVKSLIKDCIRLVEFDLMEGKIQLQQFIASDCPAIYGSQIQLEQVFINLISNAIDAILQRTCIDKLTNKIMNIEVQKGLGDVVEIIIRDSGIGINAYTENHLFEPFFTTKHDGMGIGLALCEKIINDHNGLLNFKRCEGDFVTAFIMSLPVYVDKDQTMIQEEVLHAI